MNSLMSKFMMVIGCTAVLASAPAYANVITFDDPASIAVLNDAFIGTHSTGGVTFTNNGTSMGVWDSTTPNSNGTNSLIFAGFFGGDHMSITRTGGGVFDLTSFDLTISWFDGNALETVSVNGSPINIIQSMQTFAVNLIGVTQVDITGVPSNSGYWALDNVVVNTGASVPEPASLLLVGSGLVAVTMGRRRSARR